MKIISVALALRACWKGRSLNLNDDMKKFINANAVMERILHFRLPRIKSSIRFIVSISNIEPASCCTSKKIIIDNNKSLYINTNIDGFNSALFEKCTWMSVTEYSVFFILNANETQETPIRFKIHGFASYSNKN